MPHENSNSADSGKEHAKESDINRYGDFDRWRNRFTIHRRQGTLDCKLRLSTEETVWVTITPTRQFVRPLSKENSQVRFGVMVKAHGYGLDFWTFPLCLNVNSRKMSFKCRFLDAPDEYEVAVLVGEINGFIRVQIRT